MMRKPRWAGTALALWAAMQLAACDSSPTAIPLGDDPPTTEKPTVPPDTTTVPPDTTTSVPDTTQNPVLDIDSIGDLVPGRSVPLYGENLDLITSLYVDGVPVAFSTQSKANGAFIMPATSACDVDGRPISLIANGATSMDGPLRLEEAVELEVGESRILSQQDLSCLQLPGAAEDYLFSVGSLSGGKVFDAVMTLKGRGVSGGASGASGVSASPAASTAFERISGAFDHMNQMELGSSFDPRESGRTTEDPEPFDDYANAKVGDIVNLVDWSAGLAILQAKTRDELPTFQGVVLATNAKQMIIGDLRSSAASRYNDPAVRQKLQEAADLAAPYAEDAIRAVINPDIEFPTVGAGGRMVSVLEDMHSSTLGTLVPSDLGSWIGSSGMYHTRISNALLDLPVGMTASTIIHEAAHIADIGGKYDGSGGKGSLGWYSEAIAETVTDMAARMSTGQIEPVAGTEEIWTRNSHGPFSASSVVAAPWGGPGTREGFVASSAYSRGAQIIRYAQQKMGQAGFENPGGTLHQILVSQAGEQDPNLRGFEEILTDWNLDAIAAAAGMSAEQLLEESMMADMLDDRVPAEAVARWGLPQIEGWDHTDPDYSDVRPDAVVPRTNTSLHKEITLPAAGYAYIYFPGDGERGFTLEAENVTLQDYHQVRLTRLR